MERDKTKHLKMIQDIISRMAKNSFSLKEWSVILVSALFALGAKDSNALFVYLAYFPALTFWFLDGYYLWQERLYRKLYDAVRELDDSDIDFSMNTAPYVKEIPSWFATVFSKTLLLFHSAILVTVIVVTLLVMR